MFSQKGPQSSSRDKRPVLIIPWFGVGVLFPNDRELGGIFCVPIAKSLKSQGQPVYATLNTVRNQGNENQPIRNGPIRLSIPKSGTTTAKIVTNNRTYQGGNVVSQPIRVQLRQPSSNQNSGQSSNQGGSSGTRTIIQTVQMPRSQQQAQRNCFSPSIKP